MNTICPSPRSTIPGARARARTMGASRFTRMARVTSSVEKLSRLPVPDMPALATRQSTSPASAASRSAAPSKARSAADDPVLAGQRVGQLLRALGLAGAQHQRRAALSERARDRPPEATGGPGQERRLARRAPRSNLPSEARHAIGSAVKLYVCWGTFQTPRPPDGHPCHNAYQALRMAGHDPEVVKVRGLGIGPRFMHVTTEGRKEVEELTGQRDGPGPGHRRRRGRSGDSRRIIEWAEANPAAPRPGWPTPGPAALRSDIRGPAAFG